MNESYYFLAKERFDHILSLIDREEFSKTYGCGDRVYWCWKFTDFPGARFQEFLYFLCWFYTYHDPRNSWKHSPYLLDVIKAGFHYWRKIQYPNGSFDEAYPQEKSLAAVSFTCFYLSEAFLLVKDHLDSNTANEFKSTLLKAAKWLNHADEYHGFLSNHLAVAAAACLHAGMILENPTFKNRSDYFLKKIYAHQDPIEGWMEEYGGADIGYQSHGTFYLARIWQLTQDETLLVSLKKANQFFSYFVHPDGTIGGDYGSRNTTFFFPAGYEILKDVCPCAKAIISFIRPTLFNNENIGLQQMDSHNLFPMINNYLFSHNNFNDKTQESLKILPWQINQNKFFQRSGHYIVSNQMYYSIFGINKGGCIRIWDKKSRTLTYQSTGYVTQIGKDLFSNQSQNNNTSYFDTQKHYVETHTNFVKINQVLFHPFKFIIFRILNITLLRFNALNLFVKNIIVKVLVSKKQKCEVEFRRSVNFKEREIEISDHIKNGSGFLYKHFDSFCSYHMGSSRYFGAKEHLLDSNNRIIKNNPLGVREHVIIKFE